MVKDNHWEAPAALERHRRGSGFSLDGQVTQIAFRPVHDRHGKERRFEVVMGGRERGQWRRRHAKDGHKLQWECLSAGGGDQGSKGSDGPQV